MVLGKNVAISDWECGRNTAPREGQKLPCEVPSRSHCSTIFIYLADYNDLF